MNPARIRCEGCDKGYPIDHELEGIQTCSIMPILYCSNDSCRRTHGKRNNYGNRQCCNEMGREYPLSFTRAPFTNSSISSTCNGRLLCPVCYLSTLLHRGLITVTMNPETGMYDVDGGIDRLDVVCRTCLQKRAICSAKTDERNRLCSPMSKETINVKLNWIKHSERLMVQFFYHRHCYVRNFFTLYAKNMLCAFQDGQWGQHMRSSIGTASAEEMQIFTTRLISLYARNGLLIDPQLTSAIKTQKALQDINTMQIPSSGGYTTKDRVDHFLTRSKGRRRAPLTKIRSVLTRMAINDNDDKKENKRDAQRGSVAGNALSLLSTITRCQRDGEKLAKSEEGERKGSTTNASRKRYISARLSMLQKIHSMLKEVHGIDIPMDLIAQAALSIRLGKNGKKICMASSNADNNENRKKVIVVVNGGDARQKAATSDDLQQAMQRAPLHSSFSSSWDRISTIVQERHSS